VKTSTADIVNCTPSLAELKVSYRRGKRRRKREQSTEGSFVIRGPADASYYLRRIWNKDTMDFREEVIMLCLNTSNEVLGWVNVFAGGIDSSPVDPRIVFGVALQTASTGIIVAHNHPSGSLVPSPQDIALTKRLRSGGEILNIRLLDHLIISREGFFSFAESEWEGKNANW